MWVNLTFNVYCTADNDAYTQSLTFGNLKCFKLPLSRWPATFI